MQRGNLDKELAATFEAMKQKRPDYSDVIDTFSDLYQTQAGLARAFAEHDFGLAAPDPERSRQGVSLLADAPGFQCAEQIEESRKAVLPVLMESFPFADQLRVLEEKVESGGLDMHRLALAYLRSEAASFQRTSDEIGVSTQVLAFAVRCVLGPVLAGLARSMAGVLDKMPWTQGYCPVCGSTPAIASLSRPEPADNEGLVGGGGKKRLTCSLCSHQWTFRRDHCPSCGNSDAEQKELLFAEGAKHERIEACKKCGSYLLCVDLREMEGELRLEAMPLALLHLDLIAQERNYSPLAARPWNLDQ